MGENIVFEGLISKDFCLIQVKNVTKKPFSHDIPKLSF